ncbi:MAG: hypothetical protein M8353_12585 [ANME-2 cluster archaeon]|nr:hypothetical protein [ANME-2 cluster archaeon]
MSPKSNWTLVPRAYLTPAKEKKLHAHGQTPQRAQGDMPTIPGEQVVLISGPSRSFLY